MASACFFLARLRLRQPRNREATTPFPMDPSQLPGAGGCGRGAAAPPSVHPRPPWAPSMKNRWWGRLPEGFTLGWFKGQGGCVCGEEQGAEGGLRVGATSFLSQAGIIFIFIFFKRLTGVQVCFFGGEHYFKPFGRLWVSPGHSTLIITRPFWRGSK